MNKKLQKTFEPNVRLYFIILVIFCIATFLFGRHNIILAVVECAMVAALYIYSRLVGRKRSREILRYIESVSSNMDSATRDTLQNFPLPMVIFSLDEGEMLYANDSFLNMTGEREHSFSIKISDVVPGFSARWLMEGKNEYPSLVTVGSRKFRVFGSLTHGSGSAPGIKNYMATTYWVDETEYAEMNEEFTKSRLIFSTLVLDNYEEFINGLTDKDKALLLSAVDDKITDWAGDKEGYLAKLDRDKYIFIFEERHLQGFVDDKFSILDTVREISSTKGMHPTLSIGIGKDGKNFAENCQFSSLGIEMALSRGGDQAVIKNRFSFEFFGGKTAQSEKRTKVKSRVMSNSLVELMRDASRIFIMGHKYSDLDSVGSAVGINCAARVLGKEAYIVIEEESSVARALVDRMKTLPEYEKTFISPQDAMLLADGSSLLVVVDTNRPEQVESESLLLSCNRVVVIDHHRRAATYIQNAALLFHEPYASSASELVTELLEYMVDQADILRYEAEALLSGIMLDTKNFTMRTGGRTFDAAAFLRRAGADTADVKHLMQSDMKTAMSRYSILQRAKVYKAGIAIAAPEAPESRIIAAQAADELLNISGIQASFVIFPSHDTIDISARSLGDINVQVILEKLGGGGTKATAGAQIPGKNQKEVIRQLLAAIDQYLEDNA